MKTILHIIDNLGIGGAEKLLVSAINDLKDYQHVIVLLGGPEDLRPALPRGVGYYCFDFNPQQRVLIKALDLKLIRLLKEVIRKEMPDVIHSHLIWSTYYARLVRGSTKFFYTVHSMIGDHVFKESFIYRNLEKATIAPAQNLIAVSQAVLDNYLAYIPFKGKTTVLHNYIPDVFFDRPKVDYRISGSPVRIASVGNLREFKNYKTQLKAMALLGQGYHLDIYGSGDETELKLLMQELDITNVCLQGSRSDLHKVLPHYDLYVMSSFTEGHSLALMEAMACGLPTILSNIPSFVEATENKAVYFGPYESEALAKKIHDVCHQDALRERLGRTSRELAEKYASRENYLNKLKELYG